MASITDKIRQRKLAKLLYSTSGFCFLTALIVLVVICVTAALLFQWTPPVILRTYGDYYVGHICALTAIGAFLLHYSTKETLARLNNQIQGGVWRERELPGDVEKLSHVLDAVQTVIKYSDRELREA